MQAAQASTSQPQPPKRRRKGPAQRGHGGFCHIKNRFSCPNFRSYSNTPFTFVQTSGHQPAADAHRIHRVGVAPAYRADGNTLQFLRSIGVFLILLAGIRLPRRLAVHAYRVGAARVLAGVQALAGSRGAGLEVAMVVAAAALPLWPITASRSPLATACPAVTFSSRQWQKYR